MDRSFVRRLAPGDLPALLALQEAVEKQLPAGFLWPKPEAELRAFLHGAGGGAWGIAAGSALLGAGLLRVPDPRQPLGGPRFRLVPESDWTLHTAFLEHAMVRPLARRRGCHRVLLDVRLGAARAAGMRWVCGGVRLSNPPSWASLLARGLAIADMRVDLGEPMIGLLASLAAPLTTDPADRRAVPADDPLLHRRALDDGYVGVRLAPDRTVVYERLRTPRAS